MFRYFDFRNQPKLALVWEKEEKKEKKEKEKEKEEEGLEAPYNSLTPDHPPLAAITGIDINIY